MAVYYNHAVYDTADTHDRDEYTGIILTCPSCENSFPIEYYLRKYRCLRCGTRILVTTRNRYRPVDEIMDPPDDGDGDSTTPGAKALGELFG